MTHASRDGKAEPTAQTSYPTSQNPHISEDLTKPDSINCQPLSCKNMSSPFVPCFPENSKCSNKSNELVGIEAPLSDSDPTGNRYGNVQCNTSSLIQGNVVLKWNPVFLYRDTGACCEKNRNKKRTRSSFDVTSPCDATSPSPSVKRIRHISAMAETLEPNSSDSRTSQSEFLFQHSELLTQLSIILSLLLEYDFIPEDRHVA